jgi:hypothetical protein
MKVGIPPVCLGVLAEWFGFELFKLVVEQCAWRL